MSPACEALIALAGGRCPVVEALLPNIRLEGWGADAYGEEAVLGLASSAPLHSDQWQCLADDRGAAAISDDVVWIADTIGDRLARVWRLGPGQAAPAEPTLAVAFDTELQQARRSRIAIDMQPLPADIVTELTGKLEEEVGGTRPRAFPLRTVTDGSNAVLLLAVHRLSDGEVRTSTFTYAAALLQLGSAAGAVIRRDSAGEAGAHQRVRIPRL